MNSKNMKLVSDWNKISLHRKEAESNVARRSHTRIEGKIMRRKRSQLMWEEILIIFNSNTAAMNVNDMNLQSPEVKTIRQDFSILKVIRRKLGYESIQELKETLEYEELPIINRLRRRLEYEELQIINRLRSRLD